MEWDEEAIEQALDTSRMLMESDPDGAKTLLATAHAAQRRHNSTISVRAPYDPMEIFARLLKFYGGGITDADLDRMDYRRFFGYVRMANLLSEEEQAEYDKARRGQQSSSPADVARAIDEFPRAETYEGEVVPYR